MPIKVQLNPSLLKNAASKTVIVTGGANGIGAATTRLYHACGANVVVADLPSSKPAADSLLKSLASPERASFIPANTLDWGQMKNLFKETVSRFGGIDIVVANAGIMETSPTLDEGHVDKDGELLESTEAFKVIDVNLKGTFNTLRLALHHMKNQGDRPPGGSVTLIASTSGYFGGTGVTGYVASKHGVVGLLRASQHAAQRSGVRINAVAPFLTPTHITSSFSEEWKKAGFEANTPEHVAAVIAQTSLDSSLSGECILAAGSILRKVESSRAQMMELWLGGDLTQLIDNAGKFFQSLGGYPLPKKANL